MNGPDAAQHTARDLGCARLRLRNDLIFTPHPSGDRVSYVVEDPLYSRFFRLGYTEYALISLLDGRTSVDAALNQLSTVLPHHHLTEADAASICQWLVDMDLAHTSESAQPARLLDNARRAERRESLGRLNPLVFRLPLCGPDQFLTRASTWLGWLFSPWAGAGWAALVTVAVYQVFAARSQFAISLRGAFAPSNWVWLAACWLVLKLVHELAHGIVCRRYGAAVREAGVLFILFAPLAYVDVTASWRLRSRLQRIHVAAAGMYVELLVAAAAAIIWSRTAGGWVNNLCSKTVLMASIATLAFNANPLMKFDGYYILSDSLGIPNLYTNGLQYLRYAARRYLLGTSATLPPWSHYEGIVIRLYGILSFGWRILVCTSLMVAAIALFHGAGIVLACLAVVSWMGLPAWRFARYFVLGRPGEPPNRWRFLLIAGPAVALAAVTLCILPWPGTRQAPAVVEYAPLTVVRAASDGFVRQILVRGGQRVAKAQLLVVLENRELSRDLADLELRIQQSTIRARQHEQQGRMAARQAEEEQCSALVAQRDEKRSQAARLEVRAPRSGIVVSRQLAQLEDTYLKTGDEILAIGNESEKELRVSVAQADLNIFSRRTGKTVSVNLPGRPLWPGRLDKVIPRASPRPVHPALIAVNGGPLPVKPVERNGEVSQPEHELLMPRFTAIVPLDDHTSDRLRAGQTGSIAYRPCEESVGLHLYRSFANWLRRQLRQAGDS